MASGTPSVLLMTTNSSGGD